MSVGSRSFSRSRTRSCRNLISFVLNRFFPNRVTLVFLAQPTSSSPDHHHHIPFSSSRSIHTNELPISSLASCSGRRRGSTQHPHPDKPALPSPLQQAVGSGAAAAATGAFFFFNRGPDRRARIYSRAFINGFLFRAAVVEKALRTQNNGVLTKGDESADNIEWSGVIKKIIFLDFHLDQEVALFQCDWFDVPPASRNQCRGYKKHKYGIIDVDNTIRRYKNDPYILGIQAERVFYVQNGKKLKWSTIVKMKPRNLFPMPTIASDENENEVDIDSFDIGVDEMDV